MELDVSQQDALTKVIEWYNSPNRKPVFRLFGYAGTGKSTLARTIVEQLDLGTVLYGAYTGKAAQVMRSKGCPNAQTIHRMIYKQAGYFDPFTHEFTPCYPVEYTLRSDIGSADLIVIDEVSMVNERMARDLESFGIPILVLGDPGQLPPIEGAGYYTDGDPDCVLTKIHRNVEGSPITKLASMVRNPNVRSYGIRERMYIEPNVVDLFAYDQIIVGKNKTRWEIIDAMRVEQGYLTSTPRPGERIMVLKNDYTQNVFNGMQLVVHSVIECDDDILVVNVHEVGETERFNVRVWRYGFEDQEGESEARSIRDCHGVVAASFAYAITCHKAQGSEWDNVLVVNESGWFWWMNKRVYEEEGMNSRAAGCIAEDDTRKWMYTAVTRASKNVDFAKKTLGMGL